MMRTEDSYELTQRLTDSSNNLTFYEYELNCVTDKIIY